VKAMYLTADMLLNNAMTTGTVNESMQ